MTKIGHRLATSLAAVALAGPLAAQEITFAFTDDDPGYIQRMGELVDQFEAENSGVTVEFVTAGYAQMMEQLPLQLSVGEGPDLAKITDGALMKYTLDLTPFMADPAAFRTLHGDTLKLLQGPGAAEDHIGGYMASQTLNLPFVNKTLFDQAGIPLPEAGATLAEVVDASVQVAEATGVQIPFTMDRSGHRFAGPAFSYGADFMTDGVFSFPDDAAKQYIADMYGWTQSGAFPVEMWGAAGGSRYKSMGEEFINANAVTYFAGNWMVNPFIEQIGDAFEWTVLDAPCGDGGCIPMPGGTFIAAFEHTEHPDIVARLVEFLGSEEVQREIAETFIIIPGADLGAIEYKLDDPSAQAAMQVFSRNAEKVTPEVREWQRTLGAGAVYNSIVQRMTQLIVGELTLDETYERLAADVAEAEASRPRD
jgi:alpha-1,4-digalacturonate transport system substrate-binding protein